MTSLEIVTDDKHSNLFGLAVRDGKRFKRSAPASDVGRSCGGGASCCRRSERGSECWNTEPILGNASGQSQVSISPTFYEQLFRTKVFCAAFMCLQFGLVIFWRKDFGAKVAHKMMVKLTPGVDLIKNIFGVNFFAPFWLELSLEVEPESVIFLLGTEKCFGTA